MASISLIGKSIPSMSSIPKILGNGKQGIQIIGFTDRLAGFIIHLSYVDITKGQY
jgi:hypothetical protein